MAASSRHSGRIATWYRRLDRFGIRWDPHEVRVPGGRPGSATGKKYVIKGVACGEVDAKPGVDLVFTASGYGHGVFSLSFPAEFGETKVWDLQYLTPYRRGMKYDNLELVDVDHDGDLDVVTTEEGEGIITSGLGVLWLENPLK